MTTENQTQPTDSASQEQRDREMIKELSAGIELLEKSYPELANDDETQATKRLLALASRALELESELPELLDKAKREASHAVLCGMVEHLGLDGMEKDDQESLESVLCRYAEEHEELRAENATLREADKAGGETIRHLEAELERMNGVVDAMEADAELGRLLLRMPELRGKFPGWERIELAWYLEDGSWCVDNHRLCYSAGEYHDTPKAALKAALEPEGD